MHRITYEVSLLPPPKSKLNLSLCIQLPTNRKSGKSRMWGTTGQITWFLQQIARKKKIREGTYKLRGLKEYQPIIVCRTWNLILINQKNQQKGNRLRKKNKTKTLHV